jgi:elongator complex protein 3
MWRDGEYTPPHLETAADVLTRMKLIVPPYCRIQRIQRDIPVSEITSGITNSNMRQIVQNRMKDAGLVCRCIRCREAFRTGTEPADPEGDPGDLVYEASGGTEHFISYESGGALIAYLRLRLDGSDTACIREVKVTGTGPDGWQDRGYWEALVDYAERLAAGNGATVMRATCGPGARPIYSEMGYVLEDPYMVRRLH